MQNTSTIPYQISNKSNLHVMEPPTRSVTRNMHDFNPDERLKEELKRHIHMKNRKKYMHLYQLEKYFR